MRPDFGYYARLAQKPLLLKLVQTDCYRLAFVSQRRVEKKCSRCERAELCLVRCIGSRFLVRHSLKSYGCG